MVKIGEQDSEKVVATLRARTSEILVRWEDRVRMEISAAAGVSSCDLRDGLFDYLLLLSDALCRTGGKTDFEINEARKKSKLFGEAQGEGRANLLYYSLDQVIFEYHILREVIFEVLEECGPLEVRERDIIVSSIEQAVNDTASFFISTLRDLQEVFMLTLVHDLRTPLNILRLAEEMIRGEEDPAVLRQLTGQIKNNIKRMESMIKDLLDSSRLEAGQTIPLKFEKFNLNEVVVETVGSFQDEANRFLMELKPVNGCWSQDGLKRVLENLLSNAIKYGSPKDPITVTLEEEGSLVFLSVHNYGDPLTEEEQSAVFQPFHRCQPGQISGWGIGLMLVKGIVEAHCGTVRVNSEASSGTTFTIELPKYPLKTEKIKPFRRLHR